MSKWAFAVLMMVIGAEWGDLLPWCATKLIRWSVPLRYSDDQERAETRTEELLAVLEERPGKIFKLGTALSFASPEIFAFLKGGTAAMGSANRWLLAGAGAQLGFAVAAGFVVVMDLGTIFVATLVAGASAVGALMIATRALSEVGAAAEAAHAAAERAQEAVEALKQSGKPARPM